MRLNIVVSVLPVLLSCTCLLLACSSHSGPIIDTKGVDMAKYETDLVECQNYSKQIDPATGVAKGAAGGAATGGAIGAITGGEFAKGAGVGAVLGVAKSGVRASDDKEEVVKTCMRYRGYKVLN
jgi:outer membrane lipoprotein SlyB